MQCPKCGFENSAEAKFCGKCGEPVKLPEPPPYDDGRRAAVSKEMRLGIAIGSVVIPLLGIIMGAIYMNDPNPEKKKVGKFWLFVGLGAIAFWCVCSLVFGVIGNMNPGAFQ